MTTATMDGAPSSNIERADSSTGPAVAGKPGQLSVPETSFPADLDLELRRLDTYFKGPTSSASSAAASKYTNLLKFAKATGLITARTPNRSRASSLASSLACSASNSPLSSPRGPRDPRGFGLGPESRNSSLQIASRAKSYSSGSASGMQRAKSITSNNNGVGGSGMHRAKSQGNCAGLVKGSEDAEDSKELAQRLASLDPDSLNARLLEDLAEPVTPPSNSKAAKVGCSDVKLFKFVESGAAGNWSMVSAAAQTRFHDKNEDNRGKDSEWYLEIPEGGINQRTDSTLNYVTDAKQRRVSFAAAGALWSLRFPTQEVYTAFVTELEDDVFLNSSGKVAGAKHGDSKKITREMIGEVTSASDVLEVCGAPCMIHEGEAGAPPLEVPTEAASPKSPTCPLSPSVVHFTPTPANRQGDTSTPPATPSRLSPFATAGSGNGNCTSPANVSSAHSAPISIGPSSSLQKPAAVGSPLNPERAGSKTVIGPTGPDSPRTRGSYAESASAKKASLQCQLSGAKSAQLAACEVAGSTPAGGVLTSRTSLAQLLMDCQPDSGTGGPALVATASSSSSSDAAACGPTTPASCAPSTLPTAAATAAAASAATESASSASQQATEQYPSKGLGEGATPTAPAPGFVLAALGTSPALAQAWNRLSAGSAERVMASTLALAQAWPKKGALVPPGSSSGGDGPEARGTFPAGTSPIKEQAKPWARVVGSNALAVLVILLGGLRPVLRVANSLLWAVGLLVVLLISYVAAVASYNI